VRYNVVVVVVIVVVVVVVRRERRYKDFKKYSELISGPGGVR
jgi:hypothetical protein